MSYSIPGPAVSLLRQLDSQLPQRRQHVVRNGKHIVERGIDELDGKVGWIGRRRRPCNGDGSACCCVRGGIDGECHDERESEKSSAVWTKLSTTRLVARPKDTHKSRASIMDRVRETTTERKRRRKGGFLYNFDSHKQCSTTLLYNTTHRTHGYTLCMYSSIPTSSFLHIKLCTPLVLSGKPPGTSLSSLYSLSSLSRRMSSCRRCSFGCFVKSVRGSDCLST